MKIGVSVPNIGPVATPEAVKIVAQKAEALGYNSLWTVERLLWPVKPRLHIRSPRRLAAGTVQVQSRSARHAYVGGSVHH